MKKRDGQGTGLVSAEILFDSRVRTRNARGEGLFSVITIFNDCL